MKCPQCDTGVIYKGEDENYYCSNGYCKRQKVCGCVGIEKGDESWMSQGIVPHYCKKHIKEKPMPPYEKTADDIKYDEFVRDLSATINKHSREQYSNTPDYILAEYLAGCLTVFENTLRNKEVRTITSSDKK